MFELVPRYNWDYGLKEWARSSLAAITGTEASADRLDDLFGSEPLWTTSGRASLHAILKALGLRKGARVGVPLFCCPVVFEAIKFSGLAPEFIDIDLDTYTMSAEDVERKSKGLDAIVVVHMFGHPADLDALSQAAGDIPFIEDCAHALYSKYKGRPTGMQSTAAFFSFRSGKYISAGEGSAILCRDQSLRGRIQALIDQFPEWHVWPSLAHSLSTYFKSTLYKEPWYGLAGYPLGRRLDKMLNLSAKSGLSLRRIAKGDRAIILKKIRGFEANIRQQRENANYLMQAVDSSAVALPRSRADCVANYYQFAVSFPDMESRDRAAAYLFRHGIDAAKYLDGIDALAAAAYGYKGDCPNSEQCSRTVLVIPNHYTLPGDRLRCIAKRLNEAVREVGNR